MIEEFVTIDGNSLRIEHVISVARGSVKVRLAEQAREKILASRRYVEELVAARQPVYGITTGFGKFSDVFIEPDDTARLQQNLIRSHACGIGESLPVEDVRAMMLLRANALATGHSGVRLQVIELLIDCLNHGIYPLVPRKGSLGASGDLVPLAHMGLFLTGEGTAVVDGEVLPAGRALANCGLKPLRLEAKEGLALVNGTQFMTARGMLILQRALQLADWADAVSALTCQALEGITAAYSPLIHQQRPHPGQQKSAETLRFLLKDSRLTTEPGQIRTQDAYTLRCIPQVHGASRDVFTHVRDVLHREINSATDNPLIFPEECEVISGGNFHGQPVAMALDYLAVAMAELANISERRIERLVNPQLSNLPPFLTKNGGLNSGLMIVQYAAAALVSENKVLAHPASVDSIPSSGNQEDHVSMGANAANKAAQIADNVVNVLAIELLCACQAVDYRGAEKLSPVTAKIYSAVRQLSAFIDDDRSVHADIHALSEFLTGNELMQIINGKGVNC
ncbi:MAG: histidine ammonia-lyase [Firmicutes bacterium]|nr:histidine ammonia-lyase [Bacillota bacterium]